MSISVARPLWLGHRGDSKNGVLFEFVSALESGTSNDVNVNVTASRDYRHEAGRSAASHVNFQHVMEPRKSAGGEW